MTNFKTIKEIDILYLAWHALAETLTNHEKIKAVTDLMGKTSSISDQDISKTKAQLNEISERIFELEKDVA